MAFEVDQKLENRLAENTDPPEPAHVGFDVNRIDALVFGVNTEDHGQLVGDGIEHHLVKLIVDHNLAHAVKGLFADVFGIIAFLKDVEGVMPLDIETQLCR